MPSIFDAQLAEFGTKYQVTNVILQEAKYVLPNAKYVALPNEVALKLKNELNQGNIVTIEKKLVDSPESPDIPFDDFEIKKPDTLSQLKQVAKNKVTQRVSGFSALLNIYDVFEFFIVSARLQGLGFNVLDDSNKEETYIKIIDTGNEDLITDLERFLEVKDIFDRLVVKHRNTKQYFREIDECETVEELNEVVENNM